MPWSPRNRRELPQGLPPESIKQQGGSLDRVPAGAAGRDTVHFRQPGVAMTGRELMDLMSRYPAEGKRYRWSVIAPQIEAQGAA